MWVLWKNLKFYSSWKRALHILENASALVKPQVIMLEEMFSLSLRMNDWDHFLKIMKLGKYPFYVPQILSKVLVYQNGTPSMAYEP